MIANHWLPMDRL